MTIKMKFQVDRILTEANLVTIHGVEVDAYASVPYRDCEITLKTYNTDEGKKHGVGELIETSLVLP